MKIKFNKFERVAGLFVLATILGGLASAFGVAVKKGWFENKISFVTIVKNADGIRPGTPVQIAGLRAGIVNAIDLKGMSEVQVILSVSARFHDRIRKDSVVRAMRPFVIGEKVLEISVGSSDEPHIAIGGHITSEPTMDVMDLVSGRSLGPYLESMNQMMDSMKYLAKAFLDPQRTRALIKLFDEMTPLVKSTNVVVREASVMMKDVNTDKKLVRALDNLVYMTDETRKMIPVIAQIAPDLTRDLTKIAHNMAILTDELHKVLPYAQSLAPEVPRVSKRAIEALDETVVTLKALQKSFILRANTKEVREEETERDKRAPAGNK